MQRGKVTKYKRYPSVQLADRQWCSRVLTQAPRWCSVDLRDGNQALAIPMSVAEKLELFELLVKIGFKEIEVGFPSAAQTEYDFCRRLIEENRIPDDVTIQVLTQAREHLIERSFQALQGAKNIILHLYNSTSPLQRKVTFGNASREDIVKIAIEGTKLVKKFAATMNGTNVRFQYSPESFSDTELDFSLEICTAVMDIWEPTAAQPMILNLPETVQWSMPNVHADQIEWFCRELEKQGRRAQAIVSLHTHNDRGTGVASTELGLLAGADRVEGTLFGNGERTGNLDIITVALNLYSDGIDPQLDLTDIPGIREVYERTTRMTVHARHPYGGDLVFTAFSGSHQDAIKKGMDLRKSLSKEMDVPWEVPYLTIDPTDIGCSYEAIIRINSQSGKGGVAYLLARDHGLDLPKNMHPEIGSIINEIADSQGRELSSQEIFNVFNKTYILNTRPLNLLTYKVVTEKVNGHDIDLSADVEFNGQAKVIQGKGNGPINAFVHAIENKGWKHFKLLDYRSHAIGSGSNTRSAAYIQVKHASTEKTFWGCGIHTNIEMAGLKALVSAFNRVEMR